MGKKFMGYDNASELITAIGTKIKAKYTKPDTGIPKSHLASGVQTSLGKADSAVQTETDPTVPSWAKQTNKPSYHSDEISDVNKTHKFATQAQLNQISTNQSNILYVADNIGKNILENKNYAVGSVGEHNGFRFTTLSDGGIKIESIGTHSANGDYYMQGKWNNTETSLDLTNKTYVASLKATATIASGGVRLRFFSSGNTQIGNYIGTNSSAELTGAVTIVMISAMASATLPSGGIIVYPMVCTTDAWNISHEFTPYALPNYDLTHLEAEDRAALTEEIDAGSKNIISGNWYNSSGDPKLTFTANSDGSLTISKSAATSAAVFLSAENISMTSAQYVCSLVTSNSNIVLQLRDSAGNTTYGSSTSNTPFTIPNTSNKYRPMIRIDASATFSNVTVKPMICTKAAFGVSQKFVPYQYPSPKIVATLTKSITSSTALDFTGLEYTIKANTHYRITAFAKFSSDPLEIAICNAQNSAVFGYAANQDPSGTTMAMLSVVSYVLSGAALPIAIKAKYKSASTSTVGMIIEEL